MKLPQLKFKGFQLNGANLINIAGAFIIVYLVVVLAGTVKRNYDLGHQIEDLKGQITLLQLQKDQLSYSIEYYKTDSFRDREARSKLGLQLPGENVVIIPRTPAPSASSGTEAKDTKPKSNLQLWMDFLAGRS